MIADVGHYSTAVDALDRENYSGPVEPAQGEQPPRTLIPALIPTTGHGAFARNHHAVLTSL
jgi:hypothetical protein